MKDWTTDNTCSTKVATEAEDIDNLATAAGAIVCKYVQELQHTAQRLLRERNDLRKELEAAEVAGRGEKS